MTALAVAPLDSAATELTLVQGDLSKLTPPQAAQYYLNLCQSLGLNPLSKPFEYVVLNGKKVLYARRDCTEQLRRIHNVSLRITSRERIDGVYIVTAQASLPSGRVDESTGVKAIEGLKGDALANALMACETKAKRRVTLSIVGLGMLDESELDTVQHTAAAHSPHDNPEFAQSPTADPGVFTALRDELDGLERVIFDDAANYDAQLSALSELGSVAKPSELTRRIQAASEAGHLDVEQRRELSRIWQRCSRRNARRIKELAPDVALSFVDPTEELEIERENNNGKA